MQRFDENGQITLEGAVQAFKEGGCVFYNGRVYSKLALMPEAFRNPPQDAGQQQENDPPNPPVVTLPDNLPGRDDLAKAGITNVELLKAAIERGDDLTKIKGIGEATAKAIAEFMAEPTTD